MGHSVQAQSRSRWTGTLRYTATLLRSQEWGRTLAQGAAGAGRSDLSAFTKSCVGSRPCTAGNAQTLPSYFVQSLPVPLPRQAAMTWQKNAFSSEHSEMRSSRHCQGCLRCNPTRPPASLCHRNKTHKPQTQPPPAFDLVTHKRHIRPPLPWGLGTRPVQGCWRMLRKTLGAGGPAREVEGRVDAQWSARGHGGHSLASSSC